MEESKDLCPDHTLHYDRIEMGNNMNEHLQLKEDVIKRIKRVCFSCPSYIDGEKHYVCQLGFVSCKDNIITARDRKGKIFTHYCGQICSIGV